MNSHISCWAESNRFQILGKITRNILLKFSKEMSAKEYLFVLFHFILIFFYYVWKKKEILHRVFECQGRALGELFGSEKRFSFWDEVKKQLVEKQEKRDFFKLTRKKDETNREMRKRKEFRNEAERKSKKRWKTKRKKMMATKEGDEQKPEKDENKGFTIKKQEKLFRFEASKAILMKDWNYPTKKTKQKTSKQKKNKQKEKKQNKNKQKKKTQHKTKNEPNQNKTIKNKTKNLLYTSQIEDVLHKCAAFIWTFEIWLPWTFTDEVDSWRQLYSTSWRIFFRQVKPWIANRLRRRPFRRGLEYADKLNWPE